MLFIITQILLFFVAVVFCFYFPGRFVLWFVKRPLAMLEDLFLSTVVGILFFTLLAYILSWLKLQIVLLPVLLLITFFTYKSKQRPFPAFDRKDRRAIVLVTIVSLIFSFTMILSGKFNDSISLVSIHNLDSMWHLALINELIANFPPDIPTFAGVPLRGYHFFFNFLIAMVSKILFLSPMMLFFQFFPLLLSFLWSTGVYVLMLSWSKDRSASLWAVFLTMFGGSFSFILLLQGHLGLSLDDAFGMTQPASSLVNPPFTISIIIVIASLFAMHKYITTREYGWLLPITLCVGLASMFKVYAGILLVGAFLLLVILEITKRRFFILLALLSTVLLFFSTYWVFTGKSGHLIFAPLWPTHKILADNITWYGYAEKQYTYARQGVIRKLIEIEAYGLFVFIIGSLGTRVVGIIMLIISFLRTRSWPSQFSFIIFAMTCASLLIPLFFIQSIKVFDIIQLTWYFLFFCSLFAAFGLVYIFRVRYPMVVKITLFILIVITTLPSAFEKYTVYLSSQNRVTISPQYLASLNYLNKKNSYNSTVLVLPPKDTLPNKKSLTKWYYSTSPQFVALANMKTFLLHDYYGFPGVDTDPRIAFLQEILVYTKKSPRANADKSKNIIKNGFKQYGISYIYSSYPLYAIESRQLARRVFQNEVGTIYKVYED